MPKIIIKNRDSVNAFQERRTACFRNSISNPINTENEMLIQIKTVNNELLTEVHDNNQIHDEKRNNEANIPIYNTMIPINGSKLLNLKDKSLNQDEIGLDSIRSPSIIRDHTTILLPYDGWKFDSSKQEDEFEMLYPTIMKDVDHTNECVKNPNANSVANNNKKTLNDLSSRLSKKKYTRFKRKRDKRKIVIHIKYSEEAIRNNAAKRIQTTYKEHYINIKNLLQSMNQEKLLWCGMYKNGNYAILNNHQGNGLELKIIDSTSHKIIEKIRHKFYCNFSDLIGIEDFKKIWKKSLDSKSDAKTDFALLIREITNSVPMTFDEINFNTECQIDMHGGYTGNIFLTVDICNRHAEMIQKCYKSAKAKEFYKMKKQMNTIILYKGTLKLSVTKEETDKIIDTMYVNLEINSKLKEINIISRNALNKRYLIQCFYIKSFEDLTIKDIIPHLFVKKISRGKANYLLDIATIPEFEEVIEYRNPSVIFAQFQSRESLDIVLRQSDEKIKITFDRETAARVIQASFRIYNDLNIGLNKQMKSCRSFIIVYSKVCSIQTRYIIIKCFYNYFLKQLKVSVYDHSRRTTEHFMVDSFSNRNLTYEEFQVKIQTLISYLDYDRKNKCYYFSISPESILDIDSVNIKSITKRYMRCAKSSVFSTLHSQKQKTIFEGAKKGPDQT